MKGHYITRGKFRGRRIDNDEWVYGYLFQMSLPNGIATMILTEDNTVVDNSIEPNDLAFKLNIDLFLVDPNTVGQCTGAVDSMGTQIYEGDIMQYMDDDYFSDCGTVYWNENFQRFMFNTGGRDFDLSDSDIRVTAHVVSNVFDNRPKISVNK